MAHARECGLLHGSKDWSNEGGGRSVAWPFAYIYIYMYIFKCVEMIWEQLWNTHMSLWCVLSDILRSKARPQMWTHSTLGINKRKLGKTTICAGRTVEDLWIPKLSIKKAVWLNSSKTTALTTSIPVAGILWSEAPKAHGALHTLSPPGFRCCSTTMLATISWLLAS